MTIKPIPFNTDMVRAILEGRKTVTRRVVKPQPAENPALRMCSDDVWRLEWWDVNEHHAIKVPICIGDILYVRETWAEYPRCNGVYMYRAFRGCGMEPEKQDDAMRKMGLRWRPSIHMPREAARIFLRVTNVRVERLQNITENGAIEEGCQGTFSGDGSSIGSGWFITPIDEFSKLWDSNIKPADQPLYGWAANPWVWAIEFERISKEEAAK